MISESQISLSNPKYYLEHENSIEMEMVQWFQDLNVSPFEMGGRRGDVTEIYITDHKEWYEMCKKFFRGDEDPLSLGGLCMIQHLSDRNYTVFGYIVPNNVVRSIREVKIDSIVEC